MTIWVMEDHPPQCRRVFEQGKKSLRFTAMVASLKTNSEKHLAGCAGPQKEMSLIKRSTPLKFNMEPEKKSLEKEIPFGNHHFQVPC